MTEANRPARPASVGETRRPRQSPTELTLTFTDEASVRQQSRLLEEPEWLLDERLAALERFAELPIESNRLYTTYVDLRNARLGDVRPSTEAPTEVPMQAAGSDADVPEGSAGLIELDERGVTRLALEPAARDAGVVLESLTAFRRRDPAGFRSAAGGDGMLPENDKLAHLTRALWSQGAHLRVPDGVRLERPIVLRWALGRPGAALLSRTLIDLGDDAEAKVVEELAAVRPSIAGGVGDGGDDAPQAFFTGTSEVRVGAGSSLSFASLQDFSLDQIAFQHRVAELGRQSNLRWALAQLGGRLVRSRVDNRLVGDGASVEQVEIVFAAGDQLFDLTSYTKHLGRKTTGNLLSKGVLQDSARSFMKGLITIEKNAVGTDSFLGEFGMNLSRQARAVAIPSLEIDQPDCRRAAHSSSVGPIDDSQLFYLESRGIPPEEARKFIVLGFLEPVVARIPLAAAQDR
ncbi:MAG TPA: SufD family Fe-S cluster assembly protein, partial [Candidatus Saccharimonadales bacterium]|nr:SufD family Fe-S cluster assembly protein [Candidatus Saccharimonadales bacterium]